jgi:hypothetical protein
MNKHDVMFEIDEILDSYCEGCFLKIVLKKEQGKPSAHRFCITKCTVGEHLKFLGAELNKIAK